MAIFTLNVSANQPPTINSLGVINIGSAQTSHTVTIMGTDPEGELQALSIENNSQPGSNTPTFSPSSSMTIDPAAASGSFTVTINNLIDAGNYVFQISSVDRLVTTSTTFTITKPMPPLIRSVALVDNCADTSGQDNTEIYYAGSQINAGTTLYVDDQLTTPFDGQGSTYRPNGAASAPTVDLSSVTVTNFIIVVNSSGVVTSTSPCS